jgi:hypothetical protein
MQTINVFLRFVLINFDGEVLKFCLALQLIENPSEVESHVGIDAWESFSTSSALGVAGSDDAMLNNFYFPIQVDVIHQWIAGITCQTREKKFLIWKIDD